MFMLVFIDTVDMTSIPTSFLFIFRERLLWLYQVVDFIFLLFLVSNDELTDVAGMIQKEGSIHVYYY